MAIPLPVNRVRFSLAEAARACGAPEPACGRADQSTTSVCTGSRTVSPGCLYVALTGERFDGHRLAIGELCARYKLSRLLGCGPEMAAAVAAARAAGLHQAAAVPDAEAALHGLSASLRKSDVVLVKGSRSMGMTRLAPRLVQRERSR